MRTPPILSSDAEPLEHSAGEPAFLHLVIVGDGWAIIYRDRQITCDKVDRCFELFGKYMYVVLAISIHQLCLNGYIIDKWISHTISDSFTTYAAYNISYTEGGSEGEKMWILLRIFMFSIIWYTYCFTYTPPITPPPPTFTNFQGHPHSQLPPPPPYTCYVRRLVQHLVRLTISPCTKGGWDWQRWVCNLEAYFHLDSLEESHNMFSPTLVPT